MTKVTNIRVTSLVFVCSRLSPDDFDLTKIVSKDSEREKKRDREHIRTDDTDRVKPPVNIVNTVKKEYGNKLSTARADELSHVTRTK